jgi:hypothetical protein
VTEPAPDQPTDPTASGVDASTGHTDAGGAGADDAADTDATPSTEQLREELTAAQRALTDAEAERRRLARQAEQLAAIVVERDELRAKAERLERAVIGERERNATLRFQRDRYRHQVASLRARRWWRLGAALAQARRDPTKLLRLPITLLRVLTGPGAKPDVPPPVPAG